MKVAVLCDFAEENWPSMDLVAGMLLNRLNKGQSGVGAARIQPILKPRFHRFLPSGVAFNADRLVNRHWDYPRFLQSLSRFDLFHIIDHSYSQLVHRLDASRTVVTCHDTDTFRCLFDPENERRPYWFRAMVRRTLSGLRKAGAIVCVSESTRQQVLAHGIAPPDRVHVVLNGVDPCFHPEPNEYWDAKAEEILGPPDGAIDLLHVGSTIARKRIDVLLQVVAGCKREQKAIRLVRVGAPLTAEQTALLRSLRIERSVIHAPFLPPSQLAAVYRRAALTLVTSDNEGFGLPLLESIACGTPVVASDLPSLREVGGAAAEYCKTGEVDDYIAAVLRLLNDRDRDGVAWGVRASQAVRRAGRFSWDRNALEMAGIYRGLLLGN